MTPCLTITPISAFQDNYIWLIVNQNNVAIVVDPGDAEPVIQTLKEKNLDLSGILITHHHWDHCNGVMKLKEIYNAMILGPSNEKEKIIGVDHFLNEGDEIKKFNLPFNLKVIEIPGHTLGHIAYYGEENLFCGDTLFTAGCGKIFEGTPEQMFHSLNKISSLSDESKIYCGHEYTLSNLSFAQIVEPKNINIQKRILLAKEMRSKNIPTVPSTLKEEKETNPFLRCEIESVKTAVENHTQMKLKNPAEVFKELRLWKDNFKK